MIYFFLFVFSIRFSNFQEKRDKEKQLQSEIEHEFNLNSGGRSSVLCTPSKASISLTEPEGLEELMPKLLNLIPVEKIAAIMSVRKGRVSQKLSFN